MITTTIKRKLSMLLPVGSHTEPDAVDALAYPRAARVRISMQRPKLSVEPPHEVTISPWSGFNLNLVDPQPDSIIPIDICRGLAHQFRFGGHTCYAYTVAQHSIFVSELVPSEHALQALLHDATEAYIGDLPTPVKQLCPDYKRLEARLHACIMEHFDLPLELAPEILHADRVALATEKRDLMPQTQDQHWSALDGIEPSDRVIHECWSPEKAFHEFNDRLLQLFAARAWL